MLLDTIATIVLAGMMLIPLVNVVAGVIVGAGLGGSIGAMAGLVIALSIMAAENFMIGHVLRHEAKRARKARVATAKPRAHAARLPTATPMPTPHLMGEPLFDVSSIAGGMTGMRPSTRSPASISY